MKDRFVRTRGVVGGAITIALLFAVLAAASAALNELQSWLDLSPEWTLVVYATVAFGALLTTSFALDLRAARRRK